MRRATLLSAALLLLSTPALAVTGGGPARWLDGAPDQRVAHPQAQRRLAQGEAWQDFLSRRGSAWTARFDEATGTPIRFYGEGWGVDPGALGDDEATWQLGWDILEEERALLGVDLEDLDAGALDRRMGVTTLTFERTHRGLPVEDARISLRFKADRFFIGQFESQPGIFTDPTPGLDPEHAVATALESLGLDASTAEVSLPTLVVRPLPSATSTRHALAWRMEITALDRPSRRLTWIDAQTGALIGWEEQVRFTAGTVVALIDDRYPLAGTTTAPLSGISLGNTTSALDGTFTTPGSPPEDLVWGASGTWVGVDSQDNFGDASFSGTLTEGGVVTGQPDANAGDTETRRTLAQSQAHVATMVARAKSLEIDPSFGWANQQVDANVNLNDTNCNAWYDGQSINFVRQGGGCNNTARVADVIYHEYGHGFHAWSIVNGQGEFEPALSEGLSDYMTVTITGDAGMGRNFVQGTTNPLRDMDDHLVWPGDINEDPHITGIIIGGALWDLRQALEAAQGAAGVAACDHIFWAIASYSSDIADSYEDALVADDDDGNLANGTPNQCLIDEAFGPHGLGPGTTGSAWFLDHEPLGTLLPPDQSITVDLDTGLANPECAAGEIASATVHYSLDPDQAQGSFASLSMTDLGDGAFTAELPGAPAGTFVRYWIEAVDTAGGDAGRLPTGSVTDPWYGAYVGAVVVLYESDFEADDGGFVSELLEGDPDTPGTNDWHWATPQGGGGDPDGAHSGSQAWGNDLQVESNWNGEYQNNVYNRLVSPTVQAGSNEPVLLQFRRWLTVEDGIYDQAEIWVNGAEVWQNYASPNQNSADVHHQDRHWAFRSIDVTDQVGPTGELFVTFELRTDGGLTYGGWTLDDVRIVTPDPDGEVPGDDDDAATDDDDTAPDDDDAATDDDDAMPDDDDTVAQGDDDDDSTGASVYDPPGASGGFTVAGNGCACSTSGGSGAFGLLLLPLFGLVRRRP